MSGTVDRSNVRINQAQVRQLHRLLDVLQRDLAHQRDPAELIAGQLVSSNLKNALRNARRALDRFAAEVTT